MKRISAGLLAIFIVAMSFFLPMIATAASFSPGTFSPGEFSPGTFSPGTFDPGEFSPGTFSPGEFSPGTFNPGEFNPGIFSPGTFSPGEFKPGEFSPGLSDPGTAVPGSTRDNPMLNPGTGNGPGLEPGTGLPGIGLPGTGLPGTGQPGTGLPGTGLPGAGQPGEGLPGTGLPGSGLPWKGNGSSSSFEEDSNPQKRFEFEDNEGYNALKDINDSLITPAIEGLDVNTIGEVDWEKYDQDFQLGLAKDVLKNQLNDMFDNDSYIASVGQIGMDIWDGVEHAQHIKGFLGSSTDIRNALSLTTGGGSFSAASGGAGTFLSNATKTFDMGTGIAGKAAPWMAAISTGISGAETIMNFANGDVNDGIASLGETMMSGAVVLSATGVGAPIAAGVAIVGGLLWAGAKIYKHKDTIVRVAKDVGKGIKNGFNAVKGWASGLLGG